MTKDDERSESQAKAQLESIVAMVKRLQHAEECTDTDCTINEVEDSAGDYVDEYNEDADITFDDIFDGINIWPSCKNCNHYHDDGQRCGDKATNEIAQDWPLARASEEEKAARLACDCQTFERRFPDSDERTEYHDAEKAREAIEEDALSVKIRSSWTTLGEELTADEYCILLCTGGPAVRIVGDLNDGSPSSARIEHQDWGTPWIEYFPDSSDRQAMVAYASVFYYGD